MSRLVLSVVGSLLCWFSLVFDAMAQKRVALVVGNGAYQHATPLPNPPNDARDVARALREMKFEVVDAIDLDGVAMRRRLRDFGDVLRGADVALFFYAGHGMQVDGENYLVPVDARLDRPSSLRTEALDLSAVLQDMEQAAKVNVVILDACRDNPLARTLARSLGATRSAAVGQGLASVRSGIGTVIAFATQPNNVALDAVAGDRNSPFTAALLKHIKAPGVDFRIMMDKVVDDVFAATNSRQQPWVNASLRGGGVFLNPDGAPPVIASPAPPPTPVPAPVPPPPAPPPIDERALELEAWNSLKDSRDADALERFARSVKTETLRIAAEARARQVRIAAAPPPPPQPAPAPQPTPVPRGTIKIGVAGPMTGPNAVFGAQLKNGAEMAAADINAAGGIRGQRVEIVIGDDQSKPDQGVSVANKFVAEGVKFVVGHFNSSVSIPASDVYARNDILQITPASTNPFFTERGLWNTFRTSGRDDQQGKVAADYLAKNYRNKRIAIVHDKTTYGKGLADETRKGLGGHGLRETLYEDIEVGKKDYSSLVSKLKSARIDLVYFGGLHTEAGLIIRQMRTSGVAAPLMSGDGIVSSEFVSIAGDGAAGTLMTFNPDPRKHPDAREVVRRFQAKNFEPEAYTLYSYAAVQVLKQAVERAGALEPRRVAQSMRDGRGFATVLGSIAFDQKGDVTRPDYIIYVWKKNSRGQIDYTGNEL